MIIAAEVDSLEGVPKDLVGAVIPSAGYLVFRAEGQMPNTIIETWAHIWQYFLDNDEYQRTYTTDFERHDKNDNSKVEVHIAIK